MDESIYGFGASPWPVFMTVVHVRTGQAGHCTVCRGWAAAEAHNLTLHNSGSHAAHLAPATVELETKVREVFTNKENLRPFLG